MQQPNFIPIPFAENGNKDTIPLTKQTVGRASWNTGFPPETSLPQGAGGYAPMRTDFQGVLYELSAHIFFGQSGNLYAWDATLDYNAWAHVLDTDGNGVTREYIAIAQNGPTTSNVTQPYLDVNFACWKPITLFMTDYVYPVGSIYMTTAATNPGTIFGGTWAKIESKFLVGASSTYAVGSTGGSATQTLAVTNMPSHNHAATTGQAGAGTYTVTTGSAGAHTHGLSITNGAQSAGAHTHSVSKAAQTVSVNTGSNGAHTHNITISATSMTTASNGNHTHSRGSMNITGSLVGDNEMIQSAKGCFVDKGSVTGRGAGNDDVARKLEFDASKTWAGSTSSNGSHNHSVTFPKTTVASTSAGAHTHSVSITVPAQTLTAGSNGAHTHNLTGNTNSSGVHTHSVSIAISNHTHTVSVQNTGGGSAFSIVPPYYAVYIWRRTA